MIQIFSNLLSISKTKNWFYVLLIGILLIRYQLTKSRLEAELVSKLLMAEIPSFVVGQLYSRSKDITGKYGGSGRSGIAPSRRAPAIFIFTGEAGAEFGYEDSIDIEGCFLYTGEGQEGDMRMTRGNAAIASHALNGRALHVFETTGKGRPCLYKGEFAYGAHFFKPGLDKEKRERQIIVFRLIPIARLNQIEQGNSTYQLSEAPGLYVPPTLDQLRQRALDACKRAVVGAPPSETIRAAYARAEQVKQYVLARADGVCELCLAPAPFDRKSDRSPYLEPHHINRLSDGGLDHPEYIGAICPNCHRHIHYGVGGDERNEQLRQKVKCIESNYARRKEKVMKTDRAVS
jgi:5-methylcytosine-specific restriction enzyme A